MSYATCEDPLPQTALMILLPPGPGSRSSLGQGWTLRLWVMVSTSDPFRRTTVGRDLRLDHVAMISDEPLHVTCIGVWKGSMFVLLDLLPLTQIALLI